MRNLKPIVIEILEKYPKTRNDDILLTMYIWNKVLGRNDLILTELYDLPSQDNIKRVRARLQQEGLYLPTDPEIQQKRNNHSKIIKQELGYGIDPRGMDLKTFLDKTDLIRK